MTSLYGMIITADDVETAVKTTLRAWCPAYTAEIGRQKGVSLPAVNYYGGQEVDVTNVNTFPAIAVVCPGLSGEPVRHGDGTQDFTWAVGIGIIVADVINAKALVLAKLYGAAIRTLLLQHGNLGGFAVQTVLIDEFARPEGMELDRAVASYSLILDVRVNAVVDRYGGPLTPPVDPTVGVIEGTVATANTVLTHF